MKKLEVKNKYQLVSGDEVINESTSLPKLAKSLGCALSLFYKFKPESKEEEWKFPYKGFEYKINLLGN